MSYVLAENGRISSADITFNRGFILDCHLMIDFEGGSQMFGGYALGGNPFDTKSACAEHHVQSNLAADFIGGCMAVADVNEFSALPGKVIRVRRDDAFGPIVTIGHPFQDKWYVPKERLALLAPSKEGVSA